MITLVIDTSVIIRALLGNEHAAAQSLLRTIRTSSIPCYMSPYLWQELLHTLKYSRVKRKLTGMEAQLEAFLTWYQGSCQWHKKTNRIRAVRDAKDNPVLALALTCQAQFLVTYDEDLLCLHPFQDLNIVEPAKVLSRIRTSTFGVSS